VPADFDNDVFVVEQLIRPVVNLYRITADGQPVAFVRQKRLAIKEDIRFFADESEQRELFRIKARQILEVRGRFDVTTPTGESIGTLEKVFGKSLLRSTWRVLGEDERELAWTHEKSMAMAILRRLIDFVPYGELVPLPFHFTLFVGERPVGELRREWAIRDRYTLDLTGDGERTIDRRVAVALAVALDALQSR
jgi:uncharacterized protein YxjI